MATYDDMTTFDGNNSYSSDDDYEVFVYNSVANILDLEPSSRKVFNKVILYKTPRSRSYFFFFIFYIFFLYNLTFGKNTT